MGCQGRFVPSEHPKTRVMEIEKEKKEASVASNASWLIDRVGEADNGKGGGDNASSAR